MTHRIDGPAVEPLTLAEAKAFLRIDHDDEDVLVAALVAGARGWVEMATGRALLRQTWRLVRDAWPPCGVFAVPIAPLREILAARVRAADGTAADVPLDALALQGARTPPLIAVDLARVPAPGAKAGGIEIDVCAGYGGEAAAVPPDLVEAVRLVLGHFHAHRDLPGDTARLPAAAAALVAPYRLVRL